MNPLQRVKEWFEEAAASGLIEAERMALPINLFGFGPEKTRLGPRYQLASGVSQNHSWQLVAYRSSYGTCVVLEEAAHVGGPGSCWTDVPSQRILGELRMAEAPWPGANEVFIWAPVAKNVASVVIEYQDGSSGAAELVEDPDGFDVSFFWAVTSKRANPARVVAKDVDGVELAREQTPSSSSSPEPQFDPSGGGATPGASPELGPSRRT